MDRYSLSGPSVSDKKLYNFDTKFVDFRDKYHSARTFVTKLFYLQVSMIIMTISITS